MKVYLITYDLNKLGQNYGDLYSAIKELANGWWHNLDSTWLVNTNLSAAQIRDKLKRSLDGNDSLLVVNVGGSWATSGLSDNANAWLKNNLRSAFV